jgi:tRNA(Glu) U13 pseudouridine synthase TruD
LEQYPELPLVASETKLSGDWGSFVQDLLSKDGLNLSYFEVPSTPTLRPREVMRKTFVEVKDLEILSEVEDELNSNKKKVTLSFSLGPGSYATNVVKVLFGEI